MRRLKRNSTLTRALGLVCLVIIFPLLSLGKLTIRAQTAPFDLARALAEAQDGDTIVIPPGDYRGPLVIDKSVTLMGEGWPVIDGSGQGDVLTVTAPEVRSRAWSCATAATA